MKGKVQTVCGLVDPDSLGRTLTHEHLFMEFDVAYTPAREQEKQLEQCEFSMGNLGWIRQNPYSHRPNLKFNDVSTTSAIEEEMAVYKKSGGGTIVENSTKGLNRNVNFMKDLTKNHGVHIVAGTGYYVEAAQDKQTLKVSVEEMADFMKKELTVGCEEGADVKCGIIGEIGCSWPLFEFERRVIKASGETQSATGCPVMFHPGRHHEAPEEILRLYSEAGGSMSKAVMGHLDRTIHELDGLLEFASLGSFCEYDLFGIEISHYALNTAVDMPSDAQRIARIRHLIENGFGEKILLAHDIHTKHRLTAFGGHGYSHIFNNVVPKMLDRGISQDEVNKMLVHNPKNWLTFAK
ncbi:phosphotriesterase-related protein [Palaemon carinicauda]|uniref:phosphotriesterase-related protein n=1 Tax=Palaemon carinicauda TaxID=392227 RepID=UPI0035B64D82